MQRDDERDLSQQDEPGEPRGLHGGDARGQTTGGLASNLEGVDLEHADEVGADPPGGLPGVAGQQQDDDQR